MIDGVLDSVVTKLECNTAARRWVIQLSIALITVKCVVLLLLLI